MNTEYDEFNILHNLSGFILPTNRYKHIYSKGAYSIPPVIELYDDTINWDVPRTEVHQAEGQHEYKQNDRPLYKTADTACKNFIMEVFDKTWYKELEDPDTFYTNFMALKILDHLTIFCSGIHTIDDVDIPQLMKTLFTDTNGIPQFINMMELAQQKSKWTKPSIQDKYMHAVALKSLLKLGEYETETRVWSELSDYQKTRATWKAMFREAYVVKRRAEGARER